MKNLKAFDVYFYKGFGKPKVGDYILCKKDPQYIKAPKALFNFINTNLGKVVDMMNTDNGIYDTDAGSVRIDNILYVVQWTNVPEKLKKEFLTKTFHWDGLDVKPGEFRENCLPMYEYELVEFGETPEEIESKLLATKYNI